MDLKMEIFIWYKYILSPFEVLSQHIRKDW